jgi:hypothetical protein
LDTIKYRNADFESLAANAIDRAIKETQQDTPAEVPIDQLLSTFLLRLGKLVSDVNPPGDKVLYQMGQPLGFNLLNDFGGLRYTYFGLFTAFRREIVLWRVKTLAQILYERQTSLDLRTAMGIVPEAQRSVFSNFFSTVQIWILVTSNEDKNLVLGSLGDILFPVKVFSMDDVRSEIEF